MTHDLDSPIDYRLTGAHDSEVHVATRPWLLQRPSPLPPVTPCCIVATRTYKTGRLHAVAAQNFAAGLPHRRRRTAPHSIGSASQPVAGCNASCSTVQRVASCSALQPVASCSQQLRCCVVLRQVWITPLTAETDARLDARIAALMCESAPGAVRRAAA